MRAFLAANAPKSGALPPEELRLLTHWQSVWHAEKLPGCPPAAEVASCVGRCAEAWGVLEQHLASHAFVGGDRFGFADFTAAVQANRLVRNEGFGQPGLRPGLFPMVQRWYEAVAARPAFAQHVLPRYT